MVCVARQDGSSLVGYPFGTPDIVVVTPTEDSGGMRVLMYLVWSKHARRRAVFCRTKSCVRF